MVIETMPDQLANKIAAGEVVERPASVVKELVENSIDAGSRSIKIEIEEAGLKRIKITDDGDGMVEKDAEHAFSRHATSKIRSEQDLFHVKTLGFRGEALASIAAVSQLTLKTSKSEEASTILRIEGGKILSRDKGDARKGTEITVDHLFYNTPARLKYMKTIHTELGHITDVINRMSLSHPNVRFDLYHNDRQLFQTNGRGDLLQVIAQIYGFNIAKKMIKVEKETLDYKMSGYIAKPEVTRSSKHYISTIINGRFIKSIALNKAIQNGYHTLLPIGRSPIVILQIEMDPILVDVNVHPAKLEVRFSKEKELFAAIESMIRDAFRQETLIPTQEKQPVRKEKNDQTHFDFNDHHSVNDDKENEDEKEVKFSDSVPTSSSQNTSFIQDSEPVIRETNQEENDTLMNEENSESDQPRMPVMYPIGQHHGTYIIAQNEKGLYLIDQHAAQERIKYEYFRERVSEVGHEVQELLVPQTFDFSNQEAMMIDHYQDELKKVGLFFEHFGQNTYLIRSHPTWFPKGAEEAVIRDIIDQVMVDEKIDLTKLREETAILMACKRSIKANHYLNNNEMFELLETLRKSIDPFTCPHGRPIVIHFSSYDLEKMFKRVM
ncbi:DNA mismatch repair protein MutL [Pelagirhabdus alkalitolerans]|uniref:DNA mismatch repair protein MutL n=1 Tax=Pelagirhabdus alkalitolerans TaxID=1612202 RepID=A0A1G6H5F0_9BACI|nr:DNA mismatch repair endonuclease MutL [Pelagirhabdus alkalitolerans]SDB89348.1 DNA mismatch repair protein MutL [Pelagirhabdus alkalitolerans]